MITSTQLALLKFLAFAIGFVFLLRYAFAPVGSDSYYISIAVVVACVLFSMGLWSAASVAIAFAAWHFTDFLSDSFFFYFVLPSISAVCLGGFIIRFFRFRPVVLPSTLGSSRSTADSDESARDIDGVDS